MKLRLILERLILILSVFVLAGTNRCREDYFFAQNSDVSIDGTATPTAAGTVTSAVTGTATISGTPSGTVTVIPTVIFTGTAAIGTPTIVGTPTLVPTATPRITGTANLTPVALKAANNLRNISGGGLLSELASLDKPEPMATTDNNSSQPSTNALGQRPGNSSGSNWLGEMYNSESTDAEGNKFYAGPDSDGDGYSDNLEEAENTDPANASSLPDWIKKTRFSQSFQGIDDDIDGVSNTEERAQGTDSLKQDSDGDGVTDGAEKLSGSNPLDVKSLPLDNDGDGLSDEYERASGTNPANPDTDGDFLVDSLEAVFGTNPIVKDSDGDGISDGREFRADSDPLKKDT